MKKIVIAVIILIVLILLGIGFFVLNPKKATQPSAASLLQEDTSQKNNTKTSAVIILSASKASVKVGETFAVSVNISSRDATGGTDIVILYDPTLVSVENNVSGAMNVGSIYHDYSINSDDKKGKITVSGISSATEAPIASGLFGTVTFKAIKPGKAEVKLDFTKGSTTDTNVISTKDLSDILEAVQNVEVLIN